MKLVVITLGLLLALGSAQTQRNSRDLLQGRLPYLETFWESYLQFTTRPESCADLSTFDPPHFEDFGIRILDTPDEVDVVNIAFGDPLAGDCYDQDGIYAVCEPYVCGLHIYGVAGIGDTDYDQLKEDIATLQRNGKLVKLALGGEEYGNLWGGELASSLDQMANILAYTVNDLGLDGIDLVNEEGGTPSEWLGTDAEVGQQLHFIKRFVILL